MALMAIGLNTAVAFLLRPAISTASVHALACALAIDVRIMGILLPAATCCMLAVRWAKKEQPLRPMVLPAMVFGTICCFAVVLMWPYLWPDPWGNFVQAFVNMAKFRWNLPVLYFGEMVPATRLPWHYVFVWIGLTTPLLYVVFFAVGTGATLRGLVASRLALWRDRSEMQDLLFLGMVLVPILAVVALKSVLYDGWRQMYFVYPAFLLVALRGWVAVLAWRPTVVSSLLWRGGVWSLTGVCVLFTVSWMVRAHPFQNVYFNALAGSNHRAVFELDYWGLSNRRALEMILASDKSERITVWRGSGTPLPYSLMMLKPEQRRRLNITEGDLPGDADYVLTNYRWDRTGQLNLQRDYVLAHQIVVGGEIINSVYQRKKP